MLLILIFEIITYFLYCFELKKCCDLIGVKSGSMCWIPYLNKLRLVQLEDIDADSLIVIPFLGLPIRREIVAVINIVSPMLLSLNISIVSIIGIVLFILSNLLIWYEIGYEFDEELKDSIFYLVACSCFGIHLYQWIRLYKLDIVLNNSINGNVDDEPDNDELDNEDIENVPTRENLCSDNENVVEGDVEYASDYFERIFGEQ